MSAKRLPYMPFFVADWLSDLHVRAMTPPARAAYIDLLALSWQDGALPPEPSTLARITGVSAETIRTEVLPRFEFDADGRLRHAKLHRLRAAAIKSAQERTSRAKEAADARWNAASMPAAMLDASVEQCSSDATPRLRDSETPRLRELKTLRPPDVSSTEPGPPTAQAGCPLSACDGSGAVKARGGRIIRTCACPEGRARSKRFATLCAADERAKAEKLPAAETGPLAEAGAAMAARMSLPAEPERRYPCRHCGAALTKSTRKAHVCAGRPA